MQYLLKGNCNSIGGLVALCDVGPDARRCPGAMALNTLQRDIRVENQGGTRMSETMKGDTRIFNCNISRIKMNIFLRCLSDNGTQEPLHLI